MSTIDAIPGVIWNGTVNMTNVATFQALALKFTGDGQSIRGVLPTTLDIIGRCEPQQLWKYLLETAAFNEIVILAMIPSSSSDMTIHSLLIAYFESFNRLGVVRSPLPIKNMYIMPVPANEQIPPELLNIVGRQLPSNHPDLLMVIMVLTKSMTGFHNSQTSLPKQLASIPKSAIVKQSSSPSRVAADTRHTVIKAEMVKQKKCEANDLAEPSTIKKNSEAIDGQVIDSYSSQNNDKRLWCICRRPSNDRFMIACDQCNEWYHGDCVDVSPETAPNWRKWYCSLCIRDLTSNINPMLSGFDVNHCMQKLNDLSSCTESVGRNAPPGNTIDNVLSTMQPKDMFDKLPRNTTDVKKANQLVCRAVKNIAKMKKISENKSALAEDPLRLWCVCRQPHNLRYMIDCAHCNEFFHGSCMNITIEKGTKLKKKGIEWLCPKCIKIRQDIPEYSCTCRKNQIGFVIICERCKRAYHGNCVDATLELSNELEKRGLEWLCPRCMDKSEPLFNMKKQQTTKKKKSSNKTKIHTHKIK